MTSKPLPPIKIVKDPRFQLARTLLSRSSTNEDNGDGSGGPETSIEIFANLLEECRNTFGETSLDAALCQYEYGNALFRALIRRVSMGRSAGDDGDQLRGKKNEDDGDDEKKPAAKEKVSALEKQRSIMAAAAEKRSLGADNDAFSGSKSKRAKVDNSSIEKDKTIDSVDSGKSGGETKTDLNKTIDSGENDADEDDDEDDVSLALDMMETGFAILESHTATDEDEEQVQQTSEPHQTITPAQKEWALGQLPRILVGIGDVHSYRENYANAVDAYCRALPYREEAWERMKGGKKRPESMTMESLECRRHLVETYALVAEALLSCPDGEDVVCRYDEDVNPEAASSVVAKGGGSSEENKGNVLVKAHERLSFAQSHYDMAREGLEEILYQMGKMAAAKIDIGSEKEDICYLVTTLVGIGNELTEANGR